MLRASMPAAPSRWPFALMALLSLGVVGYAWVAYSLMPVGALVHPQMRAAFEAQAPTVYAHVFGAGVALLLGPLQFWPALRRTRPRLHRWTGRAYLGLGVGLGGIAGLIMAFDAFGGLASKLGFAGLALAWLYTGVHALGAAQARDFVAHRRWMTRNFALTFAAVTLRLWLPASAVAGLPMESAYPVIAWLCWLPNLAVGEWLARRAPGRPG